MSGIGFVATLITPPAEELISAHFFSVLSAVIGGAVATILPLIGLLRTSKYRSLGIVSLLLTSVPVVTLYIFTAYHLGMLNVTDALVIIMNKLSVIAISILCFLPALKQTRMALLRAT
ncbi:MAG: hypothetical protein AAF963_02880, partial [Bacteroidota bacterium]